RFSRDWSSDVCSSDLLTIQVVIYNLPNRDCSALASNGELRISENGFNRYKTEYIDPIADILDDPQYANLRIVTIIEPDSLPNLRSEERRVGKEWRARR